MFIISPPVRLECTVPINPSFYILLCTLISLKLDVILLYLKYSASCYHCSGFSKLFLLNKLLPFVHVLKFCCLCNNLHEHLRLGTEVVTDTIRSGLQLLGNTVVKNIDTQEFIWNCCCSQFFL